MMNHYVNYFNIFTQICPLLHVLIYWKFELAWHIIEDSYTQRDSKQAGLQKCKQKLAAESLRYKWLLNDVSRTCPQFFLAAQQSTWQSQLERGQRSLDWCEEFVFWNAKKESKNIPPWKLAWSGMQKKVRNISPLDSWLASLFSTPSRFPPPPQPEDNLTSLSLSQIQNQDSSLCIFMSVGITWISQLVVTTAYSDDSL